MEKTTITCEKVSLVELQKRQSFSLNHDNASEKSPKGIVHWLNDTSHNEKMKADKRAREQAIFYQDVIDLGFKRKNYPDRDNVFYEDYGYDYFQAKLKLGRNVYAIWSCCTRNVEIHKVKGYSVESRLRINNLDDLKAVLSFFK